LYPCNLSKSTRLHIIHFSIWGPSPVVSRGGYQYFTTFVDYRYFTWIYPYRSHAHESFCHFKALVEKLHSTKIKQFQCDGAPELVKGSLHQLLDISNISLWISYPYTPQQNGVVERKNRYLFEMARALLLQSHLSKSFWYDVYATEAFLINRLLSQTLSHFSTYQLLFHKSPDYNLLGTFGCLCYPFLGSTRQDKLSPKSVSCLFLGYVPHHKG